MRTATLISLGASAVLGLGALIVARVWLPQSAHGATAKHGGMVLATVPVVVARGNIAYGAKLDAGKLQLAQLPAAAVPEGAFSSVQQVIGQSGGAPVVLIPISAREPILPAKLSGAGAKSTVAAVISEGMRAFTIGVNDVAGGGGHILPGDRVDVVLTYDLSTLAGGNPGGNNSNGKRLMSTVVIQDVRVLGMDLNADPSSTQASVAHTATLEVSVQDAEKLALAAQAGGLSLALRRTGGAEIAPVRMINVSDIGAGPRPAAPHPVPAAEHHRRVPPPAQAAAADHHAIIVVHGAAKASVEVPSDRGSGV
ncbi:MAG TPA: Flp pilus assembly protein CpaB [Caulobacteraceae bacterium]